MRLSQELSFAFRSEPASSNLKARFVSAIHLQVYLSGVAAEKKFKDTTCSLQGVVRLVLNGVA